jgi:hypothetical protein
VSDQTVMAIAGHVSAKMLRRYWHVRMLAKRKALDALSRLRLWKGTVMAQTTTQVACQLQLPIRKYFENKVGPWGFEPQTSTVSKRRCYVPLIA